MLVFAIIVVSGFYILRKRFVLAVLLVVVLLFSYDRLTQYDVVYGMIKMTEGHIREKEEGNLRLVEYKNVFTAYPSHIGTALFGNGSPHIQSSYGKYDDRLKSSIGFNLSDAGYVGVYVEYGIFMLIILFLLLIKVIRDKIPLQYHPYKLFIITLFIFCITSYSFWKYGISFAISLYALSIAGKKRNITTSISNG